MPSMSPHLSKLQSTQPKNALVKPVVKAPTMAIQLLVWQYHVILQHVWQTSSDRNTALRHERNSNLPFGKLKGILW